MYLHHTTRAGLGPAAQPASLQYRNGGTGFPYLAAIRCAVWPGGTFLPPELGHPAGPGGSLFQNLAANPAPPLPPPTHVPLLVP